MDIRSVGNTAQPVAAPIDIKVASADTSSEDKTVQEAAAVPALPTQPVPTLAQVTQAVNSINQAMQSMSRDLEFSVDEDTKETVVKIVDQKTKEVLRQIPSVEALAIAKAIDQAQQGLLIKQKA
ncbi:MAG: flagellar protein FlaG [Burkholderiaceae bacterium]